MTTLPTDKSQNQKHLDNFTQDLVSFVKENTPKTTQGKLLRDLALLGVEIVARILEVEEGGGK